MGTVSTHLFITTAITALVKLAVQIGFVLNSLFLLFFVFCPPPPPPKDFWLNIYRTVCSYD